MITKNILIITGLSFDNLHTHSASVASHFYSKTKNFFQELFDVNKVSDINQLVKSKKSPNVCLFSDPHEEHSFYCRNSCCSAVVPILNYEAKEAGYTPIFSSIKDFFLINEGKELEITDYWKKILDEKVEIVAISTSFIISYPLLCRMVELLKKEGKKIILGGVFMRKLPHKALEHLGVDYYLISEAEGRFSRLLAAIGKNESKRLDDIPGLCWRKENGCIECSRANITPIDLNSTNLSVEKIWVEENNGVIPYESVRGCAYRCSFCGFPYILGNAHFRFKSAKKIFDEWSMFADLGARHISCFDSTFTTPNSRLKELCSLLKTSEINKSLSWSVYARASDLTDISTVEAMKEAGCNYVFLGIESGDQSILENMNKRTSLSDNEHIIKACNDMEIFATTSIIIGFPGETAQTAENTHQFLQKYCSPSLDLHVWIPDFSKNSLVPIMSPEQKRKFEIQVWVDPIDYNVIASYNVNFYNEKIKCDMKLDWCHSSMNQDKALQHIFRIAESVRENLIAAEDTELAPYRSFFLPARILPAYFEYQEHKNFIFGMKDFYNRYMNGEDSFKLSKEIPLWLEKSGCEKLS